MEITPASSIYTPTRNRSRSRTRNSTANSRSTSATRRPSLGPSRRSLSSLSLPRLSTLEKGGDKPVNSVLTTLDNSLPLEFFKQDVIALIKVLKISKWHKRTLLPANLSINRISGALTNSVYKLEYRDSEKTLPLLLLRVYGKSTELIIDRDLELNCLIKLSLKKIGPRMLGIFTNGRFEQFLEGFRTLNKTDIRDNVLSQILGRRMKDLHYKMDLDIEDLVSDLPTCWKFIYKWMNVFENDCLADYLEELQEKVFLMSFADFKKLIFKYKSWLFGKYDNERIPSNFKFCHNDAQYGNLLLHELFDKSEVLVKDGSENDSEFVSTSHNRDNNLVVIDFEYLGANFPAFDLANHFCEWMADYHDETRSYYMDENKFPTKNQQLNFIKSYVEYDFQYPTSNLKTEADDTLEAKNLMELINFEIKKLYNECIFWRSSVSIYWCLWGVIQNGPLNKLAILNSTQERVVDSTYSITSNMENLVISETGTPPSAANDDGIVVEEAITSSDDDFDYLKYAGQKAALFIGDSLQFGLLEKLDLSPGALAAVKYMDAKPFEL